MSRSDDLPKVHSPPMDPSLGSFTPIYPTKTLPAVLDRISTSIPQGAWLDGVPALLIDQDSHVLRLKLTDGSLIDLTQKVFEDRNIPADTVLGVTSEQIKTARMQISQTVGEKVGRITGDYEPSTVVGPIGNEDNSHVDEGVQWPSGGDRRTSNSRSVQASDADIQLGPEHPSLIFQAIEEMVKVLSSIQANNPSH